MKNNIKKLLWLAMVIIYALSVFLRPAFYVRLFKPEEETGIMMFDSSYANKGFHLLFADLLYALSGENLKETFNPYNIKEAEQGYHMEQTYEKQIINGGNLSYNKISVANTTDKEIDIEKLMENYTLISDRKRFKILIIHSHGTEGYADSSGDRTEDKNKNVVAVGTHLEKELEKYGFDVLHDIKMHDKDDYNKSYTNSLGTTKWYLENYDDIGIIIDLHRDAIENEKGEKIKLTYDTGAEKAAQLMMVVGSNGGGLTHNNYLENLKFAISIQQTGQDMFEGLLRPVNFRDERFNQHLHSNYIILEVGTHGNTLKEAKMSVELFAQVLDKTIK